MRIFVAGGTGAIGRPLVSALVAAGHHVTVFSRREGRVTALGVPGVVPAVGDAFDPGTLARAVQAAEPEVVVNQLTSLAQTANPLAVKRGFDTTSRLRSEVSSALVAAARAAGARRVVAQSISFAYRPGPGVRTESDPLWTDAAGQIGKLTGSLATLESATLGDPAVDGVVLRYGSFYGPGTYFAPGGLYASMIAKRRLPIPGDGGGLFGLVHIDDAASATVAALEGPTGVFNVVDDVPARASEWMPLVARLLGAKPPHRRARSGRPGGGGAVPRLPDVRSARRLQRAGAGRARVVACASRLARRAAGHPRRCLEPDRLTRPRAGPTRRPAHRSPPPRRASAPRCAAARRSPQRRRRGPPPARRGRWRAASGMAAPAMAPMAAGPAPPRKDWATRLVRSTPKWRAPTAIKTNDGENATSAASSAPPTPAAA